VENLLKLGAERLADIPLELAGEHPAIKCRLRLELLDSVSGTVDFRLAFTPWWLR